MKTLGAILYSIANVILGVCYIKDIVKYYYDDFNYDGIRYLIPIGVADVLFLISLIIMYISPKKGNLFALYILLVILHNLNMGMGVDNIPFIGLFIVLLSVLFVIYSLCYHLKSQNKT